MIERGLEQLRDRRAPPRSCSACVVAYTLLYWVPAQPAARGDAVGRDHPGRDLRHVVRAAGDGPDPHLPHDPHRQLRLRRHGRACPARSPSACSWPRAGTTGSPSRVGIVVGTASGALVDILVIRRFARSSRLVLTVATIGLAQVLGAIGARSSASRSAPTRFIGNIETPISGSFFVRPYPVRGDHLLMLGFAPVVLGGLGWFLLAHRRRARGAGRGREPGPRPAARRPGAAAADDRVGDRRRRCRPSRFITKAPFTGVVPRRRSSAPPRSCPGLAVAVIARFQSLPIALVRPASASASPSGRSAGTCTAESIFDVTFLVVILVALLLPQGERSPGPRRARAAGTAPACSSRSRAELRDVARGAVGPARPRRRWSR